MCLRQESFFLEFLVWHRKEIKFEEIFQSYIFKPVGLKNCIPNLSKIALQILSNFFKVVFWGEISENKKQFFLLLLIEKFQICLKNNFEYSKPRTFTSTNIFGPHVYQKYIGYHKRERRKCQLKCRAILFPFLAITTFDVKNQNFIVLTLGHPNT